MQVRGLRAEVRATILRVAQGTTALAAAAITALLAWKPQTASMWVQVGAALGLLGAAAAAGVLHGRVRVRLLRESRALREALEREQTLRKALAAFDSEHARAREVVDEARRVETVGRLASGVAHDFNNLLTVIMSSAAMARLYPQPGIVSGSLRDIEHAANQAAELTRSMLAIGRREVAQPQRVPLAGTLARLVSAMRRLLPDDISLSLDDGTPMDLLIDPGHLERVLLNLAVNARDAIEGSGRIEVGFRHELLCEGQYGLPEGDYAALWVKDDGCGMGPEQQARIFEPFYTTKAPGRGTGMGMALVEGFVSEASGTVQLETAPGRGTTVTLWLPALAPAELGTSEVQRSGVVPSGEQGQHAVLVVEDHSEVRASMVQTLRRAGFQAIEAADGDRAVEVLSDPQRSIDLMCIDVVMPGARTAQVLALARRRRPEMRTLICSGYADEELLRRGIRAGQLACLRKPFTAVQLLSEVRRGLGLEVDEQSDLPTARVNV